MNFENFVSGYITCALWSSMDNSDDNGGCPLDCNYSTDDISPATLETITADCRKFYDQFHDMFRYDNITSAISCTPAEYAGHDFWLTRNHHGTGFWDSWTKPFATILTDAAHLFPECDFYVGDDNKLYL